MAVLTEKYTVAASIYEWLAAVFKNLLHYDLPSVPDVYAWHRTSH